VNSAACRAGAEDYYRSSVVSRGTCIICAELDGLAHSATIVTSNMRGARSREQEQRCMPMYGA